MDRLAQFEAAMQVVDTYRDPRRETSPIAARNRPPTSRVENLTVKLAERATRSSRSPRYDAEARRRVAGVSGPSGAGKSSLFRALAGLWPTGDGTVRLPSAPSGTRVLALPQRPYFPLGTLRQALTYPTLAEQGRRRARCATP